MPTRKPTYVPGVKPARGIIVTLDGLPGRWQVSDKSPNRGGWWLTALDEDAKAHSPFAEAKAPEMTRAA